MSEPIISVSGLRGIVGESLSPETVQRFAAAFVAGLPVGPIVLSRDGRTTGKMLADAVRAALCAVGRDVLDANIVATPTIGVLVRANRAAGGIQITASHNPPEYNGLKLFSNDGRVLTAALGQSVVERYRNSLPNWVGYQRVGEARPCVDIDVDHLNLICRTVNVERIRQFGFHVLLDANHGSGAVLGRKLLEHLGCQVTVLGAEPSGRFAHPPEPTAENLAAVGSRVVAVKAQVGFCQDPDADRLAVLDEGGEYIGEEYTLALCLDHVLRQTPGPVVTNCSTSRMAEDLAAKYGVPFSRSKVGEANVADEMLARKAVFGGEGNGGPIDPRVGYVRDSFVGMALLLDALAAREARVSQLIRELPRYAIHKTKLTLSAERLPTALAAVVARFPEATLDRLDGLRLDWPGKWLLIRGSNTEPIVRAIAEAPSAADAEFLCDEALRVMTEAATR